MCECCDNAKATFAVKLLTLLFPLYKVSNEKNLKKVLEVADKTQAIKSILDPYWSFLK